METNKINSFDSLFTTDHIRMLKILLSYMKPPLQGKMAVYIRFLELSYIMRFFSQNPYAGWSPSGLSLFAASASDPLSFSDISDLMDEILPFCDFTEREDIQSLKNTFQSVENLQQTMEMFRMMQELMPDFFAQNASGGNSGGSSTGNSEGNPFPFDLSELSQMMDMIQELKK